MQARTRAYTIAVIILFVACFQIVLEPLRLSPRIDPLRPGQEMRPAAQLGALYIYPPLPVLNLGLDLRGGIHVVLKARSQALLTFEFDKAIAPEDSDRVEMQGIVANLLKPLDLGGAPSIDIGTKALTVRVKVGGDTSTESEAQARRYQQSILTRLQEQFGTEYGKIQARKPDPIQMTPSMLRQVIAILEQRVNNLGLAEAVLRTEGTDKIIVQLPGISDPEQALNLIRSTAQLEFRHIPRKYQVNVESPEEKGGLKQVTFTDEAGREVPEQEVIAESPVIVRGDQLKPNSRVDHDPSGFPVVAFEFKRGPQGSDAFRNFTRTHKGQYLAIVLDNKIISAPVVKATISTKGVIEGIGTLREAQQLAVLLNSGALPIPLDREESRVVSATLGKDSLALSLRAGLVGIILVLIFMGLYYRLPGLLADIALIVYCMLVLAVLKLFGTTLTLPGIFGIILSIGMAVDANVIIFERLKEELRSQKTLKSAVEAGFNRAWTAILDSNVCSILAALVLIALGTAAIKGFAITLLIGVVCSLFTAVTITRLFMNITTNTGAAKKMSWFGV
jgi:preprotein translocase subunit SecD